MAGHLTRFDDYFDRFNAGQRKELVEAVVQAVTVEGPAQARVRFSLPTAPLGRFDRSLGGDSGSGSKYRIVWRPQRDEDPNSMPAELVIDLSDGHGMPTLRKTAAAKKSGRKKPR